MVIEKVGVFICFILCLVLSFNRNAPNSVIFHSILILDSNTRIESYDMKFLCFSRFSEANFADHGDSDTVSFILEERVRRLVLNHTMELLYSE